MKHFLTIVAVFIACNVYAQEGRLDTDKTIRKGVLPNGMTYYATTARQRAWQTSTSPRK